MHVAARIHASQRLGSLPTPQQRRTPNYIGTRGHCAFRDACTLCTQSRRGRKSAISVRAFKQDDTKAASSTIHQEAVFKYLEPTRDLTTGVLALILAGGASDYDKLFPLTSRRALPAIPVAGQHRLIDIPISSLINSGVNKIYVLTQFQSQSLNRYLNRAYNLTDGVPVGGDGFVEMLNSTLSPVNDRWSQGTADAVRQFSWILDDPRKRRMIQDVMVLPADQLYQTDFSGAILEHRTHNADVTILCHPVDAQQAEKLGIVQAACSLDTGACHVTAFQEKPKGVALDAMRTSPDVMRAFHGTLQVPQSAARRRKAEAQAEDKPYLASTGIYIFRRDTLVTLLDTYGDANDFGSDIIPRMVEDGCKVLAVEMAGPWRDVGGSLKDFYDASMELICEREPTFLDAKRHLKKPLFKAPEALPPVTYAGGCRVTTSYVAPGSIIGEGCDIKHSTIGIRSIIGDNCNITDSLILGADYYEPHKHDSKGDGAGSAAAAAAGNGGHVAAEQPHHVPIGIGSGCIITRAIVDKNACIGNNVQLVNKENVHNSLDYSALGVWIRDGIIVVTKHATIPEGTVI